MPALFVLLLKINVALLVFCAGYYLVLRRLTFYTLNRIYLVTAILFASVYPQINLSGFLQQHQQLTKPIQAVVITLQAPAQGFVKPFAQPDYWRWAELIFWAGAALFALRLLIQLFSLFKLYHNSTKARIYDYDVRLIKGNGGPFSFWKSIYVNPDRHDPADLRSILLHEQVHISEWHTLDVLLAEISTIFYWFNPGIWLMKKAIRENIEFITDRKILNTGADSKQYQYSLLNVSFSAAPQGIVNHFNISTIKKRIIMMNAKRSSKMKLTRYALLIPGVVILLLVFSITKAAHTGKSNYKPVVAAIKAGQGAAAKNIVTAFINRAASIVMPDKKKEVDTIRKGGFYLSTPAHSDSLNFVINGVIASRAEFKALDSSHIQSIEIMPGTDAAKLVDKINLKSNVLFVTTDDSEAGKRFKEKIDKLGGRPHIAGSSGYTSIGSGNSYSISSNSPEAVSSGDGESATAVTATSGEGYGSVNLSLAPRATHLRLGKTVGSIRILGDSIRVNGEPFVLQLNERDSLNVSTSFGKNMIYTVRPTKFKKLALKKGVYAYRTSTSAEPFMINTYGDAETNIEHLSTKLIMIDGKEASEGDLKKLSAADIESMSVKSGGEITKKYGDKAKNGVVFIETKKK